MMLRVAVLVLALLPGWVAAQTYRIQSGDHPGYSRLAILFRGLPEWEFGRVPGGYELRTDRPSAQYNLSDIFVRIGRNRIADVEGRSDGRLFLSVECDCHANAFEVPQGVVIDIRQGPPPADARFEASLPSTAGDPEVTDADAVAPPKAADVVHGPPTPDPAPLPPPRPAPDPIVPVPAFHSSPLRTPYAWRDELALDLSPVKLPFPAIKPAPTPDFIPRDLKDHLAGMQADLLAQISRAAGQGLIETDPAQSEASLETTQHKPDLAAPAPPSAPEPEPIADEHPDTGFGALAALDNINIETAVDRGQSGPPKLIPMTVDGTNCIRDTQLDLASWGTPPDAGTGLGPYRGRIIGEFDEANPSGIAAMARSYLYLSFGLEARVLIEAFDTEVPGADLYLALAEIMDDGHASNPGPLADQMACPNRAALWAALAHPELRKSDAVALKSVVAAFSELPLHLRRHLGPWLVERFVAIGDTKTATALLNAVARAPGDHGEGLHMMEAEIALETGSEAKAAEHLDAIVAGDGSLAPEALIRLIDTEIEAGRQVPIRNRDNAAALAFSNRGTDLGAELKRVQIRALAHGGGIESALAELDAYRNTLTAPVAEALNLEIYRLVAEEAPQALFLKVVLPGPAPLGRSDEADSIRRAIAERLIGLGLTESARTLMSDDPSVPTPEDRLLYARAYLQEQRPDLMIGYLAGLDTPEAKALRARAHELAKEYTRAAEAYAELNDEEARTRATWRSRNWPAVATLATGIERDAASLASGLPRPGAEEMETAEGEDQVQNGGPLAESRALLEGSQETRRILEELLGDPLLPES